MKRKLGFTLVEVTLFLALSSSIMLGIILATNASVSRQRYSDSVNDFADFLRGIYSAVVNVENIEKGAEEGGRDNTAIYGKFITFREDDATNTIRVREVRGDVVTSATDFGDTSSSGPIKLLTSTKVNARVTDNISEYNVPWQAVLEPQNAGGGAIDCSSNFNNCFTGAVLIFRSPVSGRVNTYVSTTKYTAGADEINFRKYLEEKMSTHELDFCVDSDDNSYPNRRNIRLAANGANSTAVYMVEMDDSSLSHCIGK